MTLTAPIAAFPGATATNINLQPFGTTLGTLTGVGVELIGSFSIGNYELLLNDPNQLVTSVSLTPHLVAFSLQPISFAFAIQGLLPVVGSSVYAQGFTFDATGTLSLFYASEPFLNPTAYTMTMPVGGNLPMGGNLSVDTAKFNPSAINGFARVTFTAAASAVPEPAFAGLVGVGVLGRVTIRRRA